MPSPLLADAFGHHVWATIRVLDVCAALDDAQLATNVPGTYGSVLDTLRGIRLAQALYHGSDHRSQVCTALTILRIEPPAIEVWDFARLDGRMFSIESSGTAGPSF